MQKLGQSIISGGSQALGRGMSQLGKSTSSGTLAALSRGFQVWASAPSKDGKTPGHIQIIADPGDHEWADEADGSIAFGHHSTRVGPGDGKESARIPSEYTGGGLLPKGADKVVSGSGMAVEPKVGGEGLMKLNLGGLPKPAKERFGQFVRDNHASSTAYQMRGREADNCITMVQKAMARTFLISEASIKPLPDEMPLQYLARLAPTFEAAAKKAAEE